MLFDLALYEHPAILVAMTPLDSKGHLWNPASGVQLQLPNAKRWQLIEGMNMNSAIWYYFFWFIIQRKELVFNYKLQRLQMVYSHKLPTMQYLHNLENSAHEGQQQNYTSVY